MTIRPKSQGIIYLRRSGDRQETSLQKQLEWALQAAQQHDVYVDASIEDIGYMQAKGLCSYHSIRLDDAITGAELDRPGLKSLVADFGGNSHLSHLFVYKRNRLGRPNSPVDMMAIEDGLLRQHHPILYRQRSFHPGGTGEQTQGIRADRRSQVDSCGRCRTAGSIAFVKMNAGNDQWIC
jgi:hypothetical protein